MVSPRTSVVATSFVDEGEWAAITRSCASCAGTFQITTKDSQYEVDSRIKAFHNRVSNLLSQGIRYTSYNGMRHHSSTTEDLPPPLHEGGGGGEGFRRSTYKQAN